MADERMQRVLRVLSDENLRKKLPLYGIPKEHLDTYVGKSGITPGFSSYLRQKLLLIEQTIDHNRSLGIHHGERKKELLEIRNEIKTLFEDVSYLEENDLLTFRS